MGNDDMSNIDVSEPAPSCHAAAGSEWLIWKNRDKIKNFMHYSGKNS